MAETHTPYYSLKKMFSFFNGVTALSGMILIGLSIYVNFRGAVLTKVLGLSSAYLFHIGYLCLVMGSVTVLLGFARRQGAAKESRGTLLSVSWICTQTPQLLHHV
ncbi:TSPAN16 [Cervus elaphus hippelaphus]|uniref:TSPAN16 n=1 Tax=Cervus elaphus hippelaphus TaxID=46360 RepID=A0A212D093_CEREH|nr:TSPAN16 [Cervus elaphus hippelaphus]